MSTIAHDVTGFGLHGVQQVPAKRTEQVTFRVSEALLKRVDTYRKHLEVTLEVPVTRSTALSRLLDRALDAEGIPTDPDDTDR
jgi:selenophosphate synthase